MRAEPVTIVLAGIGGYGGCYFDELRKCYAPDQVRLAGIVDPLADASPRIAAVKAEKIPVFADMPGFYRAGMNADVAVIVSPPHVHVPQSIAALEGGSLVLCDKPLCAALTDADRLISAEKSCGSEVLLGYQWSWSGAIQRLKRDIIAGDYGAALRAKTICIWPRGYDYYNRNAWAGRITAQEGVPVYDSPANNAAAHFLHNLLYLLGDTIYESALPETLDAGLFRAYPIENFDTVCCRITSTKCPEILFYASHAAGLRHDPAFEIVFDKGRVWYTSASGRITGTDARGKERCYGDPDQQQFKKLHAAIAAADRYIKPVCGSRAGRSQTMCVDMLQQRADGIVSFSENRLRRSADGRFLWAEHLGEDLVDCYHRNCLLNEVQRR